MPSLIAAAPHGLGPSDLAPLAFLGGGLVLAAAVVALSRSGERAYSPAMVYLTLGLATGVVADATGDAALDPFDDASLVLHAAEVAVIIALFAAGLKIDRPLRLREWRTSAVLLGVVMPLTIAAIAGFGMAALGLGLGGALVLGAALAPTDPVLAGDLTVGPPGHTEEPEPQFALTSEASLNDGLAYPFVLLGLLVAADDGGLVQWALADVLFAVPAGLVLGGAIGWGASALAIALRERRGLLPDFDAWLSLAVVLVAYGSAELMGAYGFLAAFAAGVGFRRHEHDHEQHERVHSGAEAAGNLSELAIVFLAGVLLGGGLAEVGVEGWLLAGLLLLVVRPALAFALLPRDRLDARERLFIGWFGVRGVASLYYVAVAAQASELDGGEARTIVWSTLAVIAVSILVHGSTASPWLRRLEAR